MIWDKDQNKKPSKKTQQQIAEGVNYVYDWISSRYETGKMSEEEYLRCVDKLKNMKVFLTGNDTDRVVSALRKGEVHCKSGIDAEEWTAVILSGQKNPEMLGYNARRVLEEPAIFIDVEKINEKAKNEGGFSVKGTVIHEVTHVLNLEGSEEIIDKALRGQYQEEQSVVQREPVERESITPQIISDDGVKYKREQTKTESTASQTTQQIPSDVILNEGVSYDSYLDSSKEALARLMEVREALGLKPEDHYELEDVRQMRKKVIEDRKPWDDEIDSQIFRRYSDEQILHFLNDTVYNDVKDMMRQDADRARCDVLLAERQDSYRKATDNGEKVEATENRRDLDMTISVAMSKDREGRA